MGPQAAKEPKKTPGAGVLNKQNVGLNKINRK